MRISASRRVEAPSRHRCDSCPSDEVVGGFFFYFEAVRTESRDSDAPRRNRDRRPSRSTDGSRGPGSATTPYMSWKMAPGPSKKK